MMKLQKVIGHAHKILFDHDIGTPRLPAAEGKLLIPVYIVMVFLTFVAGI